MASRYEVISRNTFSSVRLYKMSPQLFISRDYFRFIVKLRESYRDFPVHLYSPRGHRVRHDLATKQPPPPTTTIVPGTELPKPLEFPG